VSDLGRIAQKRKLAAGEAWADRFRTPDDESLIVDLADEDREVFAEVRARLLGLADTGESIRWHGLPWRWAFDYRSDTRKLTDPATAYLVPNPELPQLAVPLPIGFVAELKPRKLSRLTRERLVHATRVAGVLWTEWDLRSKGALAEALDLLDEFAGAAETAQSA